MKVIRAHPHRLAAQPALFPFFVSPFEKSSLRMGNLSINEVPTEMVTLLHFPASLRVSSCVTFCPRRVENVWISVLPVCKYKRCCIQYTNALRSGRKFGLEFFPLHSEHPQSITSHHSQRFHTREITTQTTAAIPTHKQRAPTEAIEPSYRETTHTGRSVHKESKKWPPKFGIHHNRSPRPFVRSSDPGTHPRGSPKTLPRGDIRG